MGKGQIISGGTGGEYQVKLIHERARVDQAITRLEAQIAIIDAKLPDMPEGLEKSVLKLKKLSCEKQIAFYENYTPEDDPTVTAWCADLTEDLSGYVGTIEIPGEPDEISIQPGYEGNAAYSAARDGILQGVMAASQAGAFFNYAVLPGWQKWKPTYRYGTITAIEGDTASVSLDSATSSAQGLNVNQTSTLSGVAIDYMSCNGGAFVVGDDVLIEFTSQSWSSPKIIGFKSDPQACCMFDEQFLTGAFDYTWAYGRNVTNLVPSIGARIWIDQPDYTDSVTSSGDEVHIDVTMFDGTNYYVDGDGDTWYHTNGGTYTGTYGTTDVAEITATGWYLIVDLSINQIYQNPAAGSAYGANRAKIDITVSADGLFEGSWYNRTATMRFNVDCLGFDGVYAVDITGYLETANPWAEEWKISANGISIRPKFETINVGPDENPTDPIDARILADIRSVKICGNSPDGATIGNAINASSATATSF